MYVDVSLFKHLTACCAIAGLLLVIWAAALVIVENSRLQIILDSDLEAVQESVHDAGPGRREFSGEDSA